MSPPKPYDAFEPLRQQLRVLVREKAVSLQDLQALAADLRVRPIASARVDQYPAIERFIEQKRREQAFNNMGAGI